MPFLIRKISCAGFQGSAISFPSLNFVWLFFPVFLSVFFQMFLITLLPFAYTFCALFLALWLFISFPFSLIIRIAMPASISSVTICVHFPLSFRFFSSHGYIARCTQSLGRMNPFAATSITQNYLNHDCSIIAQGEKW